MANFLAYNFTFNMENGLTKAQLTEIATVTRKIEEYVNDNGGSYSDWYIGVTNNPMVGLFNTHNVDKRKDGWIHTPTSSDKVSRAVENRFLKTHGTDGGPGGGDETSVFVYAYLKGPGTNP